MKTVTLKFKVPNNCAECKWHSIYNEPYDMHYCELFDKANNTKSVVFQSESVYRNSNSAYTKYKFIEPIKKCKDS